MWVAISGVRSFLFRRLRWMPYSRSILIYCLSPVAFHLACNSHCNFILCAESSWCFSYTHPLHPYLFYTLISLFPLDQDLICLFLLFKFSCLLSQCLARASLSDIPWMNDVRRWFYQLVFFFSPPSMCLYYRTSSRPSDVASSRWTCSEHNYGRWGRESATEKPHNIFSLVGSCLQPSISSAPRSLSDVKM